MVGAAATGLVPGDAGQQTTGCGERSMTWDNGLLPEQRVAAGHSGAHARLLAGPGTGKTLSLTRHVCFLIEQQRIAPEEVIAVTFTRAAARELRQRVEGVLGVENAPRISTLHSFALRQLLRNATRVTALPQPLRIADDWEERHIILEDLKSLLRLRRIDHARDLLNELSSDWQSLTADDTDWETRFPNPRFLAAWREHREMYRYSLRAELVYQLKKAMEQRGDFQLEGNIRHLLVDEYQDLNRCDLAVVHEIASRNVELFVAGDDDQSIYGFRKAQPEGIRRFPRDYAGAAELSLEICKRCDQGILDLGLFVARQDTHRIEKPIRTELGRGMGEVDIVRFPNQDLEATGVALICRHLIEHHGLAPDSVLILLRSDHNRAFSRPLRDALAAADVPVVASTEGTNPLDQNAGRTSLAFLRLAANRRDHLAWRTLFILFCPGIGAAAVNALHDVARRNSMGFADAVLAARRDPAVLPTAHRSRITTAVQRVLSQLDSLFPTGQDEFGTCTELDNAVRAVAETLVSNLDEREAVILELNLAVEAVAATSVTNLVRATEVVGEDIEQELEKDKVNILTMHRAKGLTAEAVIVAAAEDEYVPGRAQSDAVHDERRLLYVSLTRAKHHLFVTYCDRRSGAQRHTGRTSGRTNRTLTRFLRDGPLTPVPGNVFTNNLARDS
jgi:DNA helicase-2/ATP-dependent DNA helicase PcrA